MTVVRVLAIAVATAYLIGTGCVAFLMWVAAWYPSDNLSPEGRFGADWLAEVGGATVLLGLATLVAVVAGKDWWAAAAFGLQTAIGLVVLRTALAESEHSDGQLMLFALAVWALGLATILVSFASTRHQPPDTRAHR